MTHCYKQNEKYYLYDTESGSFFVVDELIYKICNNLSLEGETEADIAEAKADIESLKAEGLIDAPAQILENQTRTEVKALCLHICHDCNLRCSYCFAADGTYRQEICYMTDEVAKNAIDFIIERSGKIKNLEIDFFGGEPLMNFDVVKNAVVYGKEQATKAGKVFKFTMTTNCMLLNQEKIEFLNAEMDNVVLSIDGRAEVHDFMRKTPNGKGSFDVAIKNAKAFVAVRGDKDYYVRGTFTKNNLDFAKDVEYLTQQGFNQISVEPVVLPDEDPLSLQESDLAEIYAEYDELANLYTLKRKDNETWFNFFHFMIDLEHGPCMGKRIRGCGAGAEYLAVTPKGEIYPCHQFADKPEFKIGDVFKKELNEDIRQVFINSTLIVKEDCKNCWAKYHCGGGCAANNLNFNGNIDVPYKMACEMFKKRLEASMHCYNEEKGENQA